MSLDWSLILILLVFVTSNSGSVWLLINKVTNPELAKSILSNIGPQFSHTNKISNDQIQVVGDLRADVQALRNEMLQQYQSCMSGFQTLQSLLLRGATIKIDELIEQRYQAKMSEEKKKEAMIIDLAKKIEEYGRVIIKPK